MIPLILRVCAVVILVLLVAQVIDTDIFRWEQGALALFVASFFPLP